jgi:hypothetical protein
VQRCGLGSAPDFVFRSNPAVIAMVRTTVSGAGVDADACGSASATDLEIEFRVTQFSAGPIYARVSDGTNDSALVPTRVVGLPPAELAPRHPDDPNLFRIEVGQWRLPLPVLPNNGGKVRLSLWAVDPRVPPSPGFTATLIDLQNESVVTLLPPGAAAASDGKLSTALIVPVSNFDTARDARAAPNPADLPFVVPADFQ